jgi:hypothetical protein
VIPSDRACSVIFFVAMWACLLMWLREDEQQGAVERLYTSSGAAVATQPVGSGEPPERVVTHLYE